MLKVSTKSLYLVLVWEIRPANNTPGAPDWVSIVYLMHDTRHN